MGFRGEISLVFRETNQSVFISGAYSAIVFPTMERILTPHCSSSNNVSLSCSDCGQTADNKWLTLLRRSSAASVFTARRLQGGGVTQISPEVQNSPPAQTVLDSVSVLHDRNAKCDSIIFFF